MRRPKDMALGKIFTFGVCRDTIGCLVYALRVKGTAGCRCNLAVAPEKQKLDIRGPLKWPAFLVLVLSVKTAFVTWVLSSGQEKNTLLPFIIITPQLKKNPSP